MNNNCWDVLPEKFIDRFKKIVHDEKQIVTLESFCYPKSVSIRINTLITNRRSCITTLMEHDFSLQAVDWYKNAFIVTNRSKKELTELDIYKKGYFYIQSLSSMIPVIILEPKSGEKILDMAAAPGGKTTQIAHMMNNTGEIIANDISRQRLFRLKSVLAHQEVSPVTITQIPGEHLWKKYPNYFDKVLVDAPCSMEGRFYTKDPTTYTDWSIKKVHVLSHLQKRLLRSAFYTAKPGGTIVYATCTLSPEENEEVIDWILTQEKEHIRVEEITFPAFDSKPLSVWNNRRFQLDMKKTVRIAPSHAMEGFFVAKLQRIS